MLPVNGNIVILTGAGISSESGLSTFRDKGGIWSTVRIEDVATPEAFAANPVRVHAFYNTRRQRLTGGDIEPNAAHRALARLQQDWPGTVVIITQNIDDLHERGGANTVLHMHGELLKSRCGYCEDVRDCRFDLDTGTTCSACNAVGGLRPHVVWFGEMPLYLEKIEQALMQCHLFISIGTSGSVYPAAGFVASVKQQGRAQTMELNMDPSHGASLFDEARYGAATDIVPVVVESLLKARK